MTKIFVCPHCGGNLSDDHELPFSCPECGGELQGGRDDLVGELISRSEAAERRYHGPRLEGIMEEVDDEDDIDS